MLLRTPAGVLHQIIRSLRSLSAQEVRLNAMRWLNIIWQSDGFCAGKYRYRLRVSCLQRVYMWCICCVVQCICLFKKIGPFNYYFEMNPSPPSDIGHMVLSRSGQMLLTWPPYYHLTDVLPLWPEPFPHDLWNLAWVLPIWPRSFWAQILPSWQIFHLDQSILGSPEESRPSITSPDDPIQIILYPGDTWTPPGITLHVFSPVISDLAFWTRPG